MREELRPEEKLNLKEEMERQLADCVEVRQLSSQDLPGHEIFCLSVTNPKIWNSPAKDGILFKLFGKLCYNAFEPRGASQPDFNDPNIRDKAISDMNDIKQYSQKVIVIFKNGEVQSFAASTIRQVEDITLADLTLIVVDPEQRGGKQAKFLCSEFFDQKGVDVFLAISHTPAAVKALAGQSKSLGYTFYFCGQKSAEWGSRGSEFEEDIKNKLGQMVQRIYFEEYGDRTITDTPDYVGITKSGKPGVIDPIPPVTEAELKFKADDPIGETFRKGLIKENERHTPHTMYGIYVSFKPELIGKKLRA